MPQRRTYDLEGLRCEYVLRSALANYRTMLQSHLLRAQQTRAKVFELRNAVQALR